MKEQVLLYGVCAAISVAAVAITSMAKLIVCAIAKRYGKNVSGNVKEYVFTPIALLLAALGNYFWLEKGMELAKRIFTLSAQGISAESIAKECNVTMEQVKKLLA